MTEEDPCHLSACAAALDRSSNTASNWTNWPSQSPNIQSMWGTASSVGWRFGRVLAVVITGVVTVATLVSWLGGPASAPEMIDLTLEKVRGPSRECARPDGATVTARRFGPDRPIYSLHQPPEHPTLNSILDNPNYGDERAFFDIKLAEDYGQGGFCASKKVTDGDLLLARVYVENSAGDDQSESRSRDAEGVWVRVSPASENGSLTWLTAEVGSDTTKPKRIWSRVELLAPYPVRLDYVSESARIYSNTHPEGEPLGSPWNTTSLVGYDTFDGVVRPGYEFSIIIVLVVRVTRVG